MLQTIPAQLGPRNKVDKASMNLPTEVVNDANPNEFDLSYQKELSGFNDKLPDKLKNKGLNKLSGIPETIQQSKVKNAKTFESKSIFPKILKTPNFDQVPPQKNLDLNNKPLGLEGELSELSNILPGPMDQFPNQNGHSLIDSSNSGLDSLSQNNILNSSKNDQGQILAMINSGQGETNGSPQFKGQSHQPDSIRTILKGPLAKAEELQQGPSQENILLPNQFFKEKLKSPAINNKIPSRIQENMFSKGSLAKNSLAELRDNKSNSLPRIQENIFSKDSLEKNSLAELRDNKSNSLPKIQENIFSKESLAKNSLAELKDNKSNSLQENKIQNILSGKSPVQNIEENIHPSLPNQENGQIRQFGAHNGNLAIKAETFKDENQHLDSKASPRKNNIVKLEAYRNSKKLELEPLLVKNPAENSDSNLQIKSFGSDFQSNNIADMPFKKNVSSKEFEKMFSQNEGNGAKSDMPIISNNDDSISIRNPLSGQSSSFDYKSPSPSTPDEAGKVLNFSSTPTANSTLAAEQVQNYIIQSSYNNEKVVGVSLNHEVLGRIDVKVSKGLNKDLDIQITAFEQSGKDYFLENKNGLIHNLLSSGIKISDLKIDSPMNQYSSSADDKQSFQQGLAKGENFAHHQSKDGQEKQDSQRRKELWDILKDKG